MLNNEKLVVPPKKNRSPHSIQALAGYLKVQIMYAEMDKSIVKLEVAQSKSILECLCQLLHLERNLTGEK